MDKIRIAIIGAGETGTPLLRQLLEASFVEVIGLADLRDDQPGMELAKARGIRTTNDFMDFARMGNAIDIVIDVTGVAKVRDSLRQHYQSLGNTHTIIMHELIAVLLMSLSQGRLVGTKHGRLDYRRRAGIAFPTARPGRVGDPGLFGPGSAAWGVNGEMALIFGGARALLLQLAHPSVAAGVADHSEFGADPFARLWRTLDAVLSISFGDTPQAEEAAARVTARHRTVSGKRADGVPYEALDPDLLLWVHATLVDSALTSYGRFVGPLPYSVRERYYQEMKRQAVILEVPAAILPESLEDFSSYVAETIAELKVGDDARWIADGVLYPAVPVLLRPLTGWLAIQTIGSLPSRIRDGYGLVLTPGKKRAFEASSWTLRRLVALLPDRLRRWPHAREAERRVRG
jgi:uncharacterized protein (DUF2236 family)